MLKVRSSQDFLSGIIFIVIGSLGIWFGSEYEFGSAFRMGPGYLPLFLSAGLILVGLIITWRGFEYDGPPLEPTGWRPVLVVLGGVLLFGFLVDRAGLAVTAAVVSGFVTYAAPEQWHFIKRIVLAVILAVFSVLLFVYGLGQAIPVWWGQ
jgi:hypothetical protein